jgi:hypothetical protein
MGTDISRRALPTAEEPDPERWWVPEEVGRRPQTDDLPCRAVPAPHKGHDCQGPGKDDVVQGTQKGRAFGRRRRAQPECISCYDWETLRLALVLEVVKRTVDSSFRIRKMDVRTLWRSRPPPKRKKSLLAA